ncbi:MAG: LptA/OstA family protein [Veillonella sp.]|nr:LptA/OstA family protein [Veillonella sp.]
MLFPTRVDADKMTYSGSTGDVNAFGNVVVTQGNRTLLANRITGNTKNTEYRTADGPYRYLEDGGKTKDLTGDVMTYRTSDQHFDAGHTQGWSDPYYVKGQNLSYDGQTGSIEKGMITSKHAMAFKFNIQAFTSRILNFLA